MVTAIEFFDKTPIENLIGCLTVNPDKILFIGDGKRMKKWDGVYRRFLEKQNRNIELCYRSINPNELTDIVKVLSSVVEQEEACVFDLTGGDDLTLVAVGIVYERYREQKNIQLQRYNLRSGVVSDCDKDGTVVQACTPCITVEENILLHGGRLRYETRDHTGTYPWDLTPAFEEDICNMWEICREHPGRWNAEIMVLACAEKICSQDEERVDPLFVDIDYDVVEHAMARHGDHCADVKMLLRRLEVYGLIADLQFQKDGLTFRYKDAQVKRCLTKSGTVLEMKVLVAARRIADKEGTPYFHDAMNGVFIDWDGELHTMGEGDKDTENEIDAVLMRGLVPVFISCKNGFVGDSELYKLATVTGRFGGDYAKKALLATYMNQNEDSKAHLRQRAHDMQIQLVEDIHLMTDDQLEKAIRQLV